MKGRRNIKDNERPQLFIDQLDPQKNFFTKHLDLGKRPRQYASDIVGRKTIKERRELLSQVPEQLRGLVETHVRIAFDRLAMKPNVRKRKTVR
jgi:hypothetical protein